MKKFIALFFTFAMMFGTNLADAENYDVDNRSCHGGYCDYYDGSSNDRDHGGYCRNW